MRILLTGSKGFVGQALKNHLESLDHVVIDYDLPDDITDSVNFRMKLNQNNIDMVIHAAAIADLYETAKDLDKNFRVNVYGTHIVGRVCADEHVPLIFISTCCVYGNAREQDGEDFETENHTIPATIEPYACSKMAGEYILRGIQGLDYVVLRIGTVFGENMRESLFNYIALNKVLNGDTITVYGDGTQTRNYIYIDDLVRGISAAVEFFYFANGKTINICGNDETSVIETIKTAETLTGKTATVVYSDKRYGEIYRERISNQKARLLLKWQPEYNYFDAMRKTFENDARFNKSIKFAYYD